MAPLWSRGHNQPICSHLLVGLNNSQSGREWWNIMWNIIVSFCKKMEAFSPAGLFEPELAISFWIILSVVFMI